MLFIALCVIAVIVIVGTIIYNTVEDGLGIGLGLGVIAAIASGAVIFIVLMILAANPLWDAKTVKDTTTRHDLTSLNVQQQGEVHGRFYLGAGVIDGESKPGYTYMYKNRDETGATFYKMASVSTEASRVYETDTATPFVTKRVRVQDLVNSWLTPFPINSDTTIEYRFTVPTGSVVQNYQAN